MARRNLLLALVVLAFGYLLVKRHWTWIGRLLEHPVISRIEDRLARHFPRVWAFIQARFSVHESRGLALTATSVLLFAAVYIFALVTASWMSEEALHASAAGHSFPSGHSFMATAFYGFLIYLTWRMAGRDAVRIGITILLVLLICAIGLSRVILRVHWVSDVVGGFAAGLGWLICSIIITQAVRGYRNAGTFYSRG